MAGFFERIFKLGNAEAHSLIDQLEDPVKMTEQGIRDLKHDLEQALQAFAEVKAIEVRARANMEKTKGQMVNWEQKAMALLQRGQQGALDQGEADRLAAEALKRKESAQQEYLQATKMQTGQTQAIVSMQTKIEQLKSTITQYENELVTLKARAKTAQSVKKINRQLAGVDSKGTLEMLERMREKVDEEEALAEAYGDMGQVTSSIDEQIDKALLETGAPSKQSQELDALKQRMGIE